MVWSYSIVGDTCWRYAFGFGSIGLICCSLNKIIVVTSQSIPFKTPKNNHFFRFVIAYLWLAAVFLCLEVMSSSSQLGSCFWKLQVFVIGSLY